MSKAESLLKVISDVTPRKHITWPVYEGNDILEAKTVEDYVTTFFKTGEYMPFPPPISEKICLNVMAVQTEYTYNAKKKNVKHRVIIKGLVMKKK